MGAIEDQFRKEIETVVDNILDDYKPEHIRENKVIRDAIYNFGLFYKHELNIIDSPLLQRLRGIFQTALALYTYPSSCHSRFEHSLGCVVFAERMLTSLSKRDVPIDTIHYHEVRLAALLHDCGHGPFSHASEEIYWASPEIAELFWQLKNENKFLFGDAKLHEILGYFIITSKRFEKFFKQDVVPLYTSKELGFELSNLNLEHIGLFVLGKHPADLPAMKYLAQIINGPFDVDKIDYIIRDGYFSGLQLKIDIETLFLALGTTILPGTLEKVLCVDLSGAIALEQLLFCKTLLISSLYHHQKVRASICGLLSLYEQLIIESKTINGFELKSPFDFLKLDDYDIFSIRDIKFIKDIKNRILLKRVAVINYNSLDGDDSKINFRKLQENIEDSEKSKYAKSKIIREELANLSHCNISDVFIDFPEQPTFGSTGQESMIRISEETYVPLDNIHPSRGWVSAYAEYRYNVFVFCKSQNINEICKITKEYFDKKGIKLNKRAFEFAKKDKDLIRSLYPIV